VRSPRAEQRIHPSLPLSRHAPPDLPSPPFGPSLLMPRVGVGQLGRDDEPSPQEQTNKKTGHPCKTSANRTGGWWRILDVMWVLCVGSSRSDGHRDWSGLPCPPLPSHLPASWEYQISPGVEVEVCCRHSTLGRRPDRWNSVSWV
jgi:hypothetical protein